MKKIGVLTAVTLFTNFSLALAGNMPPAGQDADPGAKARMEEMYRSGSAGPTAKEPASEAPAKVKKTGKVHPKKKAAVKKRAKKTSAKPAKVHEAAPAKAR